MPSRRVSSKRGSSKRGSSKRGSSKKVSSKSPHVNITNEKFLSNYNEFIKNKKKLNLENIKLPETMTEDEEFETFLKGVEKYHNTKIIGKDKSTFRWIYNKISSLIPKSKSFLKYVVILIASTITFYGIYRLGWQISLMPQVMRLASSANEFLLSIIDNVMLKLNYYQPPSHPVYKSDKQIIHSPGHYSHLMDQRRQELKNVDPLHNYTKSDIKEEINNLNSLYEKKYNHPNNKYFYHK